MSEGYEVPTELPGSTGLTGVSLLLEVESLHGSPMQDLLGVDKHFLYNRRTVTACILNEMFELKVPENLTSNNIVVLHT